MKVNFTGGSADCTIIVNGSVYSQHDDMFNYYAYTVEDNDSLDYYIRGKDWESSRNSWGFTFIKGENPPNVENHALRDGILFGMNPYSAALEFNIQAGNAGSGGGGGGTTNYNDLSNKPQINSVVLEGNKTSADLNLQPINITLTDAAGDHNLPTTASGTVQSKIQALRNNVKNIQKAVEVGGDATTSVSEFSATSPNSQHEAYIEAVASNSTSALRIYQETTAANRSAECLLNKGEIEQAIANGVANVSYNTLSDKPSINGVELSGNKTAAQLSLQGVLNGSQMEAVNSGISSNKLSAIENHLTNTTVHVTAQNKIDWNGHIIDGDIHVTKNQKQAWDGKQNALTFDNTPTSGSTNPVTSNGIYQRLAAIEALGHYVGTQVYTTLPTSTSQLLAGAGVNDFIHCNIAADGGTYLYIITAVSGTNVTFTKDIAFSGDVSGKQDALNATQMAAVNSGINATKVGEYDTHLQDTTKHITAAERTAWNGKQNALNNDQMAAANSGITASDNLDYNHHVNNFDLANYGRHVQPQFNATSGVEGVGSQRLSTENLGQDYVGAGTGDAYVKVQKSNNGDDDAYASVHHGMYDSTSGLPSSWGAAPDDLIVSKDLLSRIAVAFAATKWATGRKIDSNINSTTATPVATNVDGTNDVVLGNAIASVGNPLQRNNTYPSTATPIALKTLLGNMIANILYALDPLENVYYNGDPTSFDSYGMQRAIFSAKGKAGTNESGKITSTTTGIDGTAIDGNIHVQRVGTFAQFSNSVPLIKQDIADQIAPLMSSVTINLPLGTPSPTAGTILYNIYSLASDAVRLSPIAPTASDIVHTTVSGNQPQMNANMLFIMGTDSTAGQGVAPTISLKYTGRGWVPKMITCFWYKNAMTSELRCGIGAGGTSQTNFGYVTYTPVGLPEGSWAKRGQVISTGAPQAWANIPDISSGNVQVVLENRGI